MTARDDIVHTAKVLAERRVPKNGDPQRLMQMFMLRYGLDERGKPLPDPSSLAMAAKHFDLTRQRMHQVLHGMLSKRHKDDHQALSVDQDTQQAIVDGTIGPRAKLLGGVHPENAARFYLECYRTEEHRARSKKEDVRMNDTQFNCLVDLGSFHESLGVRGARLVLVEGLTPAHAAREVKTSPQNVSNVKSKILRMHSKVLKAYGAKKE